MDHAGQPVRHRGEHPRQRVLVGHIGRNECEPVGAGEFVDRSEVTAHHCGAVVKQPAGGRQSDSGRRPGDDHGHVIETRHPQRAPRTSRPGRAPVSAPSRRVTTPLTTVAV